MAEPVLRVSGLEVRYGRLPALAGIDLELDRGEAVGLLGANGAGKTTLLNALSGFLKPHAGRIEFLGRPIAGTAPHAVVRQGLLQVSQERDLFGELTVLDNLQLGSLARAPQNAARNMERVFGYFPRLRERSVQKAATMSGGEQQMLAIGRALMAEPRVLLLDEPSAGLSPLFVDEIGAMMRALKSEGEISIILVEQNIRLAARVVDRFHVLRAGAAVAQGVAADLEGDHGELARNFYL
ncbi:MAG: ABC transporter ATP-binding protein [Burkholderiales bacterium]|nr:ABC transporter ATP-binding protein [Burkholderiales bacterium]OJX08188.1 MAG: hypothetical protein BGO72_01470 [Burkholderiales bacterium 70-64]